MTFAVTSTRTNTRDSGTVSRQLPTFRVEAASTSEARVKALAILLDETTSTTVEVDVQEI
jgi:hypothetical protein